MTKTDEAFQEAVMALRAWIDFLDVRKAETRDQLERARRRVEKDQAAAGPDGLTVTHLDEDVSSSTSDSGDPGDRPDSWR